MRITVPPANIFSIINVQKYAEINCNYACKLSAIHSGLRAAFTQRVKRQADSGEWQPMEFYGPGIALTRKKNIFVGSVLK